MSEGFSSIGSSVTADEVTLTKSSSNVLSIKTGTEGDLLLANSEGVFSPLTLGASGKVPQSDGSTLSYQNMNWMLVGEYELESNSTTFELDALDLASDGMYLIFYQLQNVNPQAPNIYADLNQDTTSGNYKTQKILLYNTNITTSIVDNLLEAVGGFTTYTAFGKFLIRPLINGYVRMEGDFQRYEINAVSYEMQLRFTDYAAASANITNFRIRASIASSLLAGSKMMLFKMM